jgi:type IV secretion system protein VirB5
MKGKVFFAGFMLSASMSASAAGIPVIDGANLANALQQFQQLQQQYENMQQRLANAEDQLGAQTGTNNMGSYGRSEYWNDWEQPDSANDALANQYDVAPNPADSYADDTRESNRTQTRRIANESRAVDEMLDRAVERFDAINELIQKIDSSPDAKTTADLQARIAGEQAMLTNEMLKMQLLQQQYAMQRRREASRANHRESTSLLDVVDN